MRVLSILLLPLAVASFSLDSRRQALAKTSIAFVTTVVGPNAAKAFSQQLDDNIVEPSQQPTNGKVDLNGAFIGDYKQFPGMYPHAAGKIASNGPYSSTKDLYKIPGITKNDIAMFKKYEGQFTVIPPGRMFGERINNRVST